MADIIERRAVRAILLTPENEILLIRVTGAADNVFWIAPGGGIEPGESLDDALHRELREELGLVDFEPGPPVWLRHHTFNWDGRRISQREEYRIVRITKFEAAMHDVYEASFSTELRWWSVAELARAAERLTPLSLAQIVADFLLNGPPHPLPPEEVLTD